MISFGLITSSWQKYETKEMMEGDRPANGIKPAKFYYILTTPVVMSPKIDVIAYHHKLPS